MNTQPNTLPDLLLGLRRRINEGAKENRLKNEITISQLEVLWFIESSEKKSMEAIATHLNIKPPSVTALVDKMEKSGLVSREKDRHDRRIIHVALTRKTKIQIAALWKQKESVLNTIVAKLSLKDRKELERILSFLIEK